MRVPSSNRLAVGSLSRLCPAGPAPIRTLTSACISTVGRKCCSRNNTVMPLAVIERVGMRCPRRTQAAGRQSAK